MQLIERTVTTIQGVQGEVGRKIKEKLYTILKKIKALKNLKIYLWC